MTKPSDMVKINLIYQKTSDLAEKIKGEAKHDSTPEAQRPANQ